MIPIARLLAVCAVAAAGSRAASAAFAYPGCDDAAESQFRYVPVVGRSAAIPVGKAAQAPLAVDNGLLEPLHLAFDSRPDGKADIYWIERGGAVKRFDAGSSAVSALGTVSGLSNSGEMGLSGIALDPGFKTNRRIYLFYANNSPAEFRLSRFTLDASGKLDNAAQQILLRFKRSGENHTGGAMAFDAKGDLWITVGKNAPDYPNSYNETNQTASTEATAANLADYRGGILRIHPDGSERGYSVPDGNLGPYWSAYFKDHGRADVAAEYADTSKVRPELYVKGTRNAYSISVHPTKRWLAWGEFGVNTTNTYTEEHNLVTHPAFGGYPYFAGGFGPGAGTGFYALWSGPGANGYNSAHPGLAQSADGPINKSTWNKGPQQLPPVTPAMHTYMHGSGAGAVTGPIYAYDPASPSRIKWPPHFDGAWFVTDWVQGTGTSGFQGAKIFKLNADGDAKIDSLKWFQSLGWVNPISFDQGPDGALYVINYAGNFGSTGGTHIGRLEYTGTCAPAVTANRDEGQAPARSAFHWDTRDLWVDAGGPSQVTVRDAEGKLVHSARLEGPGRYALGDRLPHPGLYLARLEQAGKVSTFKLARL